MKKKISLLLCILIMTLSFMGCSDKSDAGVAYDEASLQSNTEAIISLFTQMNQETVEQFATLSEFELNYIMLSNNIPADGKDFVGMIHAWEAAEQECGEYISHGDFVVEEKNDGVIVSTSGQYAEREATISFTFDQDSNMKSLDVSAKFSLGEILTKAGLNTLLGMGTVFVVLIFLAYIIDLLKYIPAFMDGFKKKEEAATASEESLVMESVPSEDVTDDLELIAVITAAIAASEGTSKDGFVVRSIRRRPSNNWI